MAEVCLPNCVSNHHRLIRTIERSQHQYTASWETTVFSLGREWIQSCAKHPFCQEARPHADPMFRPTRLIKVTSPTSARLVETSKQETSDYLALSHCWGKPEPSKVFVALDSPEKMETRTHSLPVQELAKNFQDAIRITSGLGLQCLWIDSICIIQGDKADWEIESAKMGYVYANAICTISATASDNAHRGCFFPNENFRNDCTVGIDWRSSLVVGLPAPAGRGPKDVFQEKVEKAPVTTRAWTFQERILSKRVLHFSKGVLLFECSTMLATEYHSQGVPHTATHEDLHLPIKALLKTFRYENQIMALAANSVKRLFRCTLAGILPMPFVYALNVCSRLIVTLLGGTGGGAYTSTGSMLDNSYVMFPIESTQDDGLIGMRSAFQAVGDHPRHAWSVEEKLEFHQQWFELVDPYSARDLTNHTDRLVAIIGVATFIQEQTGTQFLAGLWGSSLMCNLLWICDMPNRTRGRSTMLPTWSWASVDGRIRHELTPDMASAQQTASNDKRLEDISPLVQPECWQVIALEEHSGIIYNAALVVNSCLLIELRDDEKFFPDIELDRDSEELYVMPIVGLNHGRYNNKKKRVYGIPVLSVGGKLDRIVYGIVLREVAERRGTFERVGYFSGLEAPVLERARRRVEKMNTSGDTLFASSSALA